MYKKFFKRLIDFLVAFFGLLVLSPLFLLITIGLFFTNRGKPYFFQLRPGKNSKIFTILKFKTMTDQKDEKGNLLEDSHRMTKIGNFVRKTSLDELPQLLNVLKGDMSLIGPRPLLPHYVPLYSEEQKKRHQVRPGITGLAQVNGRNGINWKDKFAYDVWYVENMSLLMDFKIVLKTINKVIKSEGISSATSVSMEAFNGNN